MNNSIQKNPEKVSKKEKKPSYRVKRATWFKKDEYEKLLILFQTLYPKEFPKKKIINSLPTLRIRHLIKKEKKIDITDTILARFLYQYILIQKHKTLEQKEYDKLLDLIPKAFPKDFEKDYSKTPTQSIFKKVKENKKINISRLTLHRFVNQYLKNQKSYFRYRDKKDKEILAALQKSYPDAFPKDSSKLLKLGIFEDIQKDGKVHIIDKDLKNFLGHYTKTEDYLKCYFTNPVRHDLNGNIVAPTTKKDRFFAEKILKNYRKNN